MIVTPDGQYREPTGKERLEMAQREALSLISQNAQAIFLAKITASFAKPREEYQKLTAKQRQQEASQLMLESVEESVAAARTLLQSVASSLMEKAAEEIGQTLHEKRKPGTLFHP